MASAPWTPEALPGPADASPRGETFRFALGDGDPIVARDDWYSDRVRCDHPSVSNGRVLGEALRAHARRRGRDAVLVLARAELGPGLADAGYLLAAKLPGFYAGRRNGVVAYRPLNPERGTPADPGAAAWVDALVDQAGPPERRSPVRTERADSRDAPAIAALIAGSFSYYPTPSGVPSYVAKQIREGIPFRMARDGAELVACASADLVPEARTAELTDCATRPDHRGQGLMQALLADLMEDLRQMDYPTAFTLARAKEPGMNLVFRRLGFTWRGRTPRSCRIGDGFEDVNVWSRRL